MTQAAFHMVDKLALNIIHKTIFIEDKVLCILQQSKEVIPCNSKPVLIRTPKTTNTDVEVSMETASEATPARMAGTETQVERCVAKEIWLRPKEIGTIKVVSKVTGLIYFEPSETVVRQENLMPAKGITEVQPNVTYDMLLANVVLFPSSKSMVYIIVPEQIGKERRYTIPTVKATSKLPV